MKKILFQLDSISDCGRDRNVTAPNSQLGSGFPNLIAARLCCDRSGYEVFNRAVSGSRIADTYARWIEDTLNLEYDILSILHGINDVGFSLRLKMGASREKFAFIYDRMLTEATEGRSAHLVLLEPFLLRVDMGEDSEYHNDIYKNFSIWYGEIRARGEIVRDLAEKHGAIFVPLAEEFDRAAEKFSASHWSPDGIHPSPAGHELIARRWLNACTSIL